MGTTKEFSAKTNRSGRLRLDIPLHQKNAPVKVHISFDNEGETRKAEPVDWKAMLRANPAFDFLADREEDLYTADDGVSLKP